MVILLDNLVMGCNNTSSPPTESENYEKVKGLAHEYYFSGSPSKSAIRAKMEGHSLNGTEVLNLIDELIDLDKNMKSYDDEEAIKEAFRLYNEDHSPQTSSQST